MKEMKVFEVTTGRVEGQDECDCWAFYVVEGKTAEEAIAAAKKLMKKKGKIGQQEYVVSVQHKLTLS